MILLEEQTTDWIIACSALAGVPLALWGIITLFRRDNNKERHLAAIEKVASSQGEALDKMQLQIDQLADQTIQFQHQSSLMFDSNKLFEEQLELQRQIMVKSVKPFIHVGQWDYENNLYVTLQNVGSGLAIINKLSVTNKENEKRNNLFEWLPEKLPAGVNYEEYWTPHKSFVMQPAQIIKLVQVPIDDKNPEQVKIRETLRAILGQLTIKVEYQDIYDNVMPATSVHISYFLRTNNMNTEDQ